MVKYPKDKNYSCSFNRNTYIFTFKSIIENIPFNNRTCFGIEMKMFRLSNGMPFL